MSNIIKVRFIRDNMPSGTEYTYHAQEGLKLAVDDKVAVKIVEGIVTQIDVPEEEILKFGDGAKTIIGKISEPDEDDENDAVIASFEEHANCAIGMLTLAIANRDWGIVKQAHAELLSAGAVSINEEDEDNDVPFTGVE
jgi:hypothetical protein